MQDDDCAYTRYYLVVAIGLGIFGYLALFSIVSVPPPRGVDARVDSGSPPGSGHGPRIDLAVDLHARLHPRRAHRCSTLPQIADGGRGTVEGSTRCNALFLTYAGDASYSPPLWPALVVGVVLATGASLIARRWIYRRVRRTDTERVS